MSQVGERTGLSRFAPVEHAGYDEGMPEIHSGDLLAGKYRVERVLGAGGMGFVVAATHIHLEQLVALKFIKQGALESDEAVHRFLREARAAVRLKSEHVARVFDVGTLESGEPYMVMEYLDGQDLHAVAKRGPLPIEEACEYVLQACEALAEAHSLGIVHRDIKPANLFLTKGRGGIPNIKVLDFGISRVAAVAESSDNLEVTNANTMLGSPRFMSPEQMLDPTDVDGRTDVWSLGIILYKLLSGALPFESETLGGLLTKVMNAPLRPIHDLRGDLPPALVAVLEKCMEKDRDNRYRVAELAHALAPFAPARAQVSLEHIAQYLEVPETNAAVTATTADAPRVGAVHLPVGASASIEPSARLSSPPTGGTAAPWASVSRPPGRSAPSRAPIAALVLGVLGIAIVGGFSTLGKRGAAQPTAGSAGPGVPSIVSVPTAPAVDPTPPADTAPGIDPRSLPVAPPRPGDAALAAQNAKKEAATTRKPPPRPGAQLPRKPGRAIEPPPPPRPDEGIPTTRD